MKKIFVLAAISTQMFAAEPAKPVDTKKPVTEEQKVAKAAPADKTAEKKDGIVLVSCPTNCTTAQPVDAAKPATAEEKKAQAKVAPQQKPEGTMLVCDCTTKKDCACTDKADKKVAKPEEKKVVKAEETKVAPKA